MLRASPLRRTALGLLTAIASLACTPENEDGVPDAVVDLRINEVAAAGIPVDWFELTNVGGDDIALDDVTFSDDPTLKEKGGFPEGAVVGAGAFVVVEVDDAGVGFKLGSDEELHLYARENGAEIDAVDWDEGDSPAGGSFARNADGQGEFRSVTPDSRGRTNP